MFGEDLVEAFREFKSIWDPDWKMNPGKVVDPYRITDNLRLGSDYRPPHPDVHFAYPEDHGDFAHVGVRCVGIGKCRRTDGGVMCPSYMVTRDEKHTTRGRARLLFEMLHGDPVRGLWRSDIVKSALDLCLACKGCKKDCPVSVDMATYKAEFLSHYYARRIRPRSAYALGLIDRVARVASRVPRLTNALASTRPFKFAAGIHPARDVPEFAPHTFKHWFANREAPPSTGRRVIVWPDTFTNFFHPEIGAATVELLESAGYEPVVPDGHLCCGRPLYDFGMLALAKSYLRKILDALEDDILRGTPVVGMEPELPGRLPRRAQRPVPERRERDAVVQAVVHAQRVPRARGLGTAAAGAPRARAEALSSPRGRRLRRRAEAPRGDGARPAVAGDGMLRNGRLLRLRALALRRLESVWRAHALPRDRVTA
jgi:hypothetical protein